MLIKVSLKTVTDGLVSLVLVVAAVLLVYRSYAPSRRDRPPDPVPPDAPISLEDAVTRGDTKARTVMVMFSDFECPFCRRFTHDVLPGLDNRYVSTGRLLLAFKHLPLSIHPHTVEAAVSAECARRQAMFWGMHDGLFAAPSLDLERQRTVAAGLGIDMKTFEECRANDATKEVVTKSVAAASLLGVQSTPTFFLGVRTQQGDVNVEQVIAGARPLNEFVMAVDALVASAK